MCVISLGNYLLPMLVITIVVVVLVLVIVKQLRRHVLNILEKLIPSLVPYGADLYSIAHTYGLDAVFILNYEGSVIEALTHGDVGREASSLYMLYTAVREFDVTARDFVLDLGRERVIAVSVDEGGRYIALVRTRRRITKKYLTRLRFCLRDYVRSRGLV